MDYTKYNAKDAAIIKNNPDMSPYDLVHQKGLSQAAYRKLVEDRNAEKQEKGTSPGQGQGQGQGSGMGQGTGEPGQDKGQGQEHGQGEGLNKPEPKTEEEQGETEEGMQDEDDEEERSTQNQYTTGQERKGAMRPDSIEPDENTKQPNQPQLSPIKERSGATKKILNRGTGQVNSMASKLADNLARNYPNEYKIVD